MLLRATLALLDFNWQVQGMQLRSPRSTWLSLLGLLALGCGGGAVGPRASNPIDGTFDIATIDGIPLPALIGLGQRPSPLILVPADSVVYASDQISFVTVDDTSGTLTRSRRWLYRYRPLRTDAMTIETKLSGSWVEQGNTYVMTYDGFADTLTLDPDANGFTARIYVSGVLLNGAVGRFIRPGDISPADRQ
jgi:hypothetical protein